MPELPDITIYLEQLERRIVGQTLEKLEIAKPFVLRTFDPPVAELVGTAVLGVRRMGKRIVLALEGERFIVIHLMIAGRLRWRAPAAKLPPKGSILAKLVFANGVLVLTEAGTTRRASMHLVRGEDALRQFDRGGLEVLSATLAEFAARLRSENHTLKRALADPRLFSGIGNAYSDEILHRARLSPVMLTRRLGDADIERLFGATRTTLEEWTSRLRAEAGESFPEKVTAFREAMAVHGRFGEPCRVCESPVQRIRYASNETNYCARCQTGGKLLADRALSRLLGKDWPKSIDDIE
ncbi:MAG TPA: DNA-formamidopyrimidine glycosylase family protein [Gemmatimonadaceae bacterium]|nr:DNA-formamidopyrimidine glycosylase family protein [Gemmatimonadaceae bacterium]